MMSGALGSPDDGKLAAFLSTAVPLQLPPALPLPVLPPLSALATELWSEEDWCTLGSHFSDFTYTLASKTAVAVPKRL